MLAVLPVPRLALVELLSPARVAVAAGLAGFLFVPGLLAPAMPVSWDVHRSAILLAELAVAGVWVVGTDDLTAPRMPRWMVAVGLVWLVAAWAAVAGAVHVGPAVLRQAEWAGHGLFGLAVWDAARRPGGVSLVAWSVLAGFGAVVAALAALWTSLPAPEAFAWGGSIPFHEHVRRLGFHAVAAIGLASWPLVRPVASLAERSAGWAALAVGWAVLAWTGSRGSLGAAVVLGAVAVVLVRPRGRVAGAFASAAAVGIAASLLFPVDSPGMGIGRLFGMSSGALVSANDYTSDRLTLWSAGLEAWRSRPWLGLGPDGFAFLTNAGYGSQVQPHNVVVQAVVEWGVLGALPFLALLAGGLVVGVRSVRADPDAEIRAARTVGLAGLAAACAGSLFDGLFHNPQTLILLAASAALASLPGAGAGRPVVVPRRPLRLSIVAAAVLFAGHLVVVRAVWAPGVPSPDSPRATLAMSVPVGMRVEPVAEWARAWSTTDPDSALELARWGQRHSRSPWAFATLEGDLLAAQRRPEAAERYAIAGRLQRPLDRTRP